MAFREMLNPKVTAANEALAQDCAFRITTVKKADGTEMIIGFALKKKLAVQYARSVEVGEGGDFFNLNESQMDSKYPCTFDANGDYTCFGWRVVD